MRPIVVGVDGSAAGRVALEEAAGSARGNDRLVVVVFVRHFPHAGLRALAFGTGAVIEDAMDELQIVAEAEAIAVFDPAGVRWRFEVGRGEPAAELMRIAAAHDAETIVITARRHGALASFTLGVVTAQLLRRWQHCLLVVHPHADGERRMPSTR